MKISKNFEFTESSVLDFCKFNKDADLFFKLYKEYPHYFLPINGKQQLLSNACLSGMLDVVMVLDTLGTFNKDRYLLNACKSGNAQLVRYVLRDPETHNLRGSDTESPLEYALDNTEIMEALSEKYHTLETKFQKYNTFFKNATEKACRLGLLESLNKIIELFGTEPSEYCISEAASNGHFEIVRFLEESKYVCVKTSEGVTKTAAKGDLKNLMYMIEKGFPCVEKALNMAAANGHLDVVRYLTENKFPATRDAMNQAIRCNHIEVVRYLCENRVEGADGYPMRFAMSNNNLAMVKLLDSYPHLYRDTPYGYDSIDIYSLTHSYGTIGNDILEYLLTYRPNDIREYQKYLVESLLVKASITRNSKLLNIILSNSSVVSVITKDLNLMNVACKCGWVDLVRDIHNLVQSNYGHSITSSALEYAIINNRVDVVKFLLANTTLTYGNLSLIEAFTRGNTQVILCLLPYKGDLTFGNPSFIPKPKIKQIIEQFNLSIIQILLDFNYISLDQVEIWLPQNQVIHNKFKRFKANYKQKYNL
ncbi:hypothetical protein DLAC_04843 [Tieghemostelium lacteum]|uniref:Uncharacterized protein n=1 Tax=Tieghemostelium lacteum TaxID=361077 RepID=A0A151ZJG9_TIELA|nr:hypothetical protein DLAC_04843 [Tieghemostelium lacteum]|eukprot:KYQ93954.1 hypothetical protein DLAC_04843 [Tieghemostelium lacteum]